MDNQQPSVNNGLFYQKPKKGYGYIYKYTSPSGKSYIGQTINSLADRAKSLTTGIGYKKCSLFWKAINKYGWSNFLASILIEVPIEELNKKEQEYINYYNTIAPNGYNLANGGSGGKKKQVFVYSAQNGDFLEVYSSLSEAYIQTGVPIETISTIISTNNGFKNYKDRRISHNLTFLDYYMPNYDISNLSRKNYCKIYVYDREGNYLQSFETIVQAAKELDVGESSIRKCLNGTSLHVKYYQFKKQYFDKILPIPKNSKSPISVIQIDPITQQEIAIFPSLKAAARAVGLSSGDGIKKVIERGKGTSGGFFWKINEGSTTKCE